MNNLRNLILIMLWMTSCSSSDSDSKGELYDSSSGTGGSMARFAITGDVLYTVSSNTMSLFDIENAALPTQIEKGDLKIGFDIETIFPMDTLLFIGSRSGMYVFSISEPHSPKMMAQVQHLRSCDPVVAQGEYAYVTLNTNFSSCGAVPNNVLQIYNISQPTVPVLEKTLPMTSPTGLGIDGSKLFVCDRGLKVFDIADPLNITQIDDIANISEVDISEAYDVIPLQGLLILTAKEGLYQFDYSEANLRFISKIEINR